MVLAVRIASFNKQLRVFAQLNGYLLLDWDKLVSSCTNVSAKNSRNGRIKLLVTEMKNSYGVLI